MDDDSHWTTWPPEAIRAGVLAILAIEKAARSSAEVASLLRGLVRVPGS